MMMSLRGMCLRTSTWMSGQMKTFDCKDMVNVIHFICQRSLCCSWSVSPLFFSFFRYEDIKASTLHQCQNIYQDVLTQKNTFRNKPIDTGSLQPVFVSLQPKCVHAASQPSLTVMRLRLCWFDVMVTYKLLLHLFKCVLMDALFFPQCISCKHCTLI